MANLRLKPNSQNNETKTSLTLEHQNPNGNGTVEAFNVETSVTEMDTFSETKNYARLTLGGTRYDASGYTMIPGKISFMPYAAEADGNAWLQFVNLIPPTLSPGGTSYNVVLPSEAGVLATQEWVNAQGFGAGNAEIGYQIDSTLLNLSAITGYLPTITFSSENCIGKIMLTPSSGVPYESLLLIPEAGGIIATQTWVNEQFLSLSGGTLTGNLQIMSQTSEPSLTIYGTVGEQIAINLTSKYETGAGSATLTLGNNSIYEGKIILGNEKYGLTTIVPPTGGEDSSNSKDYTLTLPDETGILATQEWANGNFCNTITRTWENDDTTSAFASGTITLAVDNKQIIGVYITYRILSSGTTKITQFHPIGQATFAYGLIYGNLNCYARQATINNTSDTTLGITFSNGQGWTLGSTDGSLQFNDAMIPTQIDIVYQY